MRNRLFILCCLLLSGCNVDKTLIDAQTFNNNTPYTEKVAYYQQKAQQNTGATRDAYLLQQAGRLIHDGMYPRARQLLFSLDDLPVPLKHEQRLLIAALYEKTDTPSKAKRMLDRVLPDALMQPGVKAFYHRLNATLAFKQARAADAIAHRLALNAYLANKNQQVANLRNLWVKLNALTVAELDNALSDESLSAEVSAWLSLNRLLRVYDDNASQLRQALHAWLIEHMHTQVSQLLSYDSLKQLAHRHPKPKQIALLLPLSGPYSGPGKAVRDGFMQAFYRASFNHANVRFYDTNGQQAVSIYHNAVANGADFVVGPLLKQHTKAISGLSLKVPTLLLNDSVATSKTNLYQFAISPQEEVAEVAFKAYEDGHRRALLIAPSGAWGASVAKSFGEAWQYVGGEVADKLVFDKQTNMNAAIKALLHVDKSQQRYAELRRVIGKRASFVARRRDDFDVIFLLAYPSKAREIRPLLRYYYAGDVPVYSSSMIFSGYPDRHADRDLNGIIFADMPWLVDNKKPQNRRWPEQLNSYNRLFAVGQDAYLLSQQFQQLHLFPLLGLSDTSGTLYLDSKGKIHRQLLWLTFKNGVPQRRDGQVQTQG